MIHPCMHVLSLARLYLSAANKDFIVFYIPGTSKTIQYWTVHMVHVANY